MKYQGIKTKEISFPLGGIGTGSIGLAGNGRLIDWEIFNIPSKGSTLGLTHFAIKAEDNENVLDARVLNSDLNPPYQGNELLNIANESAGFGHGTRISNLTGYPHFKDSIFTGEFPFATIDFFEEKFPGKVSLKAFNPFIPMNSDDSSIPCAMFEIEVENNTGKDLNYTVSALVGNPAKKASEHKLSQDKDLTTIQMFAEKRNEHKTKERGDLSISTIGEDISYQQYVYRGGWFDTANVYWKDLNTFGKFQNRIYNEKNFYSTDDHALLANHKEIKNGEKKSFQFIISWNYSVFEKYWENLNCNNFNEKHHPEWNNYYSKLFKDSFQTAKYVSKNWYKLYNETKLFADSLTNSTLPNYVIDAVSANISIIKSPTVLRLSDGHLYGFEGCNSNSGSCEGSCQHVWNYAYAVPFLFPDLERSFRDLEYKYSFYNGKLGFRLQLPLGAGISSFRACVDGQFGTIIKCYREWKISGDDNWLKSKWEQIKLSLEYAWSENNPDKWDIDKDGVIEGRQHHTLDMELFGPNSWLNGFYLCALKACSEIADYFEETDKAKEYKKLYEKGKEWTDKNLFNGEYYFHKIDLNHKDFAKLYSTEYEKEEQIKANYWSEEHSEIKYQIGEGSSIDQVLAQWHANIIGLGEIFNKSNTRKAAKSIFTHNYKKTMRDFFNPCRIYSLNDEAGTIICAYPQNAKKPVISAPYAEETMNGFEYSAGILMIQEGLINEGLEVVKAVRDKYDGEKRNPWNEFECGSNYARSMASYSLIPTLSGFTFDMTKSHIGFNPVINKEHFKSFWAIQRAWGNIHISFEKTKLIVNYGDISLNSFGLPSFIKEINSILLNEKPFNSEFYLKNGSLIFKNKINLNANDNLTVNYSL